MSISFSGGNIVMAMQTNAGTVHTTTFYSISVGYLLVPIAIVSIVTVFIWLCGRERSN